MMVVLIVEFKIILDRLHLDYTKESQCDKHIYLI